MTVIAMPREMGSMGRDVALGLAEALKLQLVQHEIVEHVEDKMHVARGAVNRFLEGKASLLERWRIDGSGMSAYTVEELLEVAAQGNVLIRGWGATYALRDVPHVLCVRVCAPVEMRVQVLMERMQLADREDAIREIESNDAAHAKTMLHLFQVDWQNPFLYDATFNMSKLSVPDCVASIKALSSQPAFQETDASRAVLADLTLAAQVKSALRASKLMRDLGPYFDVAVEPCKRRVRLRGVVREVGLKREVGRLAGSVPGVAGVDNELTVLKDYMAP